MINNIISKVIAHKAGIMLGGACVGVVVTAVMATKDKTKHERNISCTIDERYQEVKDDFDTSEEAFASIDISRKEETIIFAKSYWRTGLSMAVTFGLMILAHRSMVKELAATSAALGVLSAKYKDLQSYLKTEYPEVYEKINEKIKLDRMQNALSKDNTPKIEGKTRYYDVFTDQVFYATEADVLKAECKVNKCILNNNEATYYDFLKALPKDANIVLRPWMKKTGWYIGVDRECMETSYEYNSGYIGMYIEPIMSKETVTIDGKKLDVTSIAWNHCPDFDPVLDEKEIQCISDVMGLKEVV